MYTMKYNDNYEKSLRYHELCREFLRARRDPFTVKDVKKAIGCGTGTAYRTLDDEFVGYYAWRRRGNGYYRLFFPRGYSERGVRDYLARHTKSGVSTAQIFYRCHLRR